MMKTGKAPARLSEYGDSAGAERVWCPGGDWPETTAVRTQLGSRGTPIPKRDEGIKDRGIDACLRRACAEALRRAARALSDWRPGSGLFETGVPGPPCLSEALLSAVDRRLRQGYPDGLMGVTAAAPAVLPWSPKSRR